MKQKFYSYSLGLLTATSLFSFIATQSAAQTVTESFDSKPGGANKTAEQIRDSLLSDCWTICGMDIRKRDLNVLYNPCFGDGFLSSTLPPGQLSTFGFNGFITRPYIFNSGEVRASFFYTTNTIGSCSPVGIKMKLVDAAGNIVKTVFDGDLGATTCSVLECNQFERALDLSGVDLTKSYRIRFEYSFAANENSGIKIGFDNFTIVNGGYAFSAGCITPGTCSNSFDETKQAATLSGGVTLTFNVKENDDIKTGNNVTYELLSPQQAENYGTLSIDPSTGVVTFVRNSVPVPDNLIEPVYYRLRDNTCAFGGKTSGGVLYIQFPSAGALPVTLTSFGVTLNNRTAYVKWSTSEEFNNREFVVERSINGVSYSPVGSRAGTGTTNTSRNYTFDDDLSKVTSAFVYYRLRQVDIDGRFTFSKVIAVKLSTNDAVKISSVFPNPAKDYINIVLNAERNENITIRVFNTEGKQVRQYIKGLQTGANTINLDNIEGLGTGMYFIKIDGRVTGFTGKFLKQ